MVVLVVLGALVTMGLPMFLGARTTPQERAAQAQLRSGNGRPVLLGGRRHVNGLRRELHGGSR